MTTTKEIELDGIPYDVTYTITAGRSGVHTLANGDPGYPDDTDEIEVHKVTTCDEDGNEIDVTDSKADEAIDELYF